MQWGAASQILSLLMAEGKMRTFGLADCGMGKLQTKLADQV